MNYNKNAYLTYSLFVSLPLGHFGVPNSQLIKERHPLCKIYNNTSVAEQNSIDVSWSVLMQDRFANLRHAISPDDTHLARFKQLCINLVMATDICDAKLKKIRNQNWACAFSERAHSPETERDRTNRKATIVLEHLIQASE
jgi:3'5'-cyclic nucleotide phosphodiesterase